MECDDFDDLSQEDHNHDDYDDNHEEPLSPDPYKDMLSTFRSI